MAHSSPQIFFLKACGTHSFACNPLLFQKKIKEVIQNGPGRLSSDIRFDRPPAGRPSSSLHESRTDKCRESCELSVDIKSMQKQTDVAGGAEAGGWNSGGKNRARPAACERRRAGLDRLA